MMMMVMENSGGRPLLEKRITRPHIASHSALKGFSHTCKNIFILLGYFPTGLHKLCYPTIRDRSTWSKFGAHGEHGDVFVFSNLGAL